MNFNSFAPPSPAGFSGVFLRFVYSVSLWSRFVLVLHWVCYCFGLFFLVLSMVLAWFSLFRLGPRLYQTDPSLSKDLVFKRIARWIGAHCLWSNLRPSKTARPPRAKKCILINKSKNKFQQFRSSLPGWIFQGRPARYCWSCFVHGVGSVLQCFVLRSINFSFVFPSCSLFCLVSWLFLLVCWFVFPCFVYGLGLAVHCFVYGWYTIYQQMTKET